MEFSKDELQTILTACLAGATLLDMQIRSPILSEEEKKVRYATSEKMRQLYNRIQSEWKS